jgi:polyphosphate kinase 2 (PPK2 family)
VSSAFATKEEAEEFLETVPAFEAMIERSGITLLKYYLDISCRSDGSPTAKGIP